jgi:hypothetical protein
MKKSELISLLQKQSSMCEQLSELIDNMPFINEEYSKSILNLQEKIVYKNWKEIDDIIALMSKE